MNAAVLVCFKGTFESYNGNRHAEIAKVLRIAVKQALFDNYDEAADLMERAVRMAYPKWSGRQAA